MRRPAGIAVLAVFSYASATWCVLWGLLALISVKAFVALFAVFHPAIGQDDLGMYTLEFRIQLSTAAIIGALISYFLGRGLWRLRNWARVVVLVLTVLDLLLGGFPAALSPLSRMITLGPAIYLLGWVLSLMLAWYLLSTPVRTAFGVKGNSRGPLVAILALGVLSLTIALLRSEKELAAVKWHLQHGNRAVVNGVSFPVYLWHAPYQNIEHTFLRISDHPGPLRFPEFLSSIDINGYTRRTNSATGEEVANLEAQFLEKDMHRTLTRTRLLVGAQTLSCMQSGSILFEIRCHGDGPIYEVTFFGDARALERFQSMMAKAQ